MPNWLTPWVTDGQVEQASTQTLSDRPLATVIDKKSLSEQDIRTKFITPAIQAAEELSRVVGQKLASLAPEGDSLTPSRSRNGSRNLDPYEC